MKKLLFLGFLFLAAISQGQTVSEMSRILNSGPKIITSNAASSLNADILPAFDLTNAGYKIISVDIAGTWSGTISFQGRSQTGIWYSIASYSPDNPGVFVLTTTGNGHFNIPTLGFDQIRIRMTSYTSGTATSFVTGFLNNIAIPTPASTGGVGGGSGTQYQNGAASGSPTGTLAMGYDGSNLRAIKTDNTGALAVSFPGSLAVTGTFWQTTQPVSISGSVPVTGTFWQGTQPVSGPLTDAQLRASAVNVSGTASQNTSGASITTTNITGNNQNAFSLDLSSTPYRKISVQLTGTWSAILNFQGSNDNSNWINLLCNTPTGGVTTTDISTNDLFNISCPFRYIRLRSTSYTSGTAVATAYGFLSAFDLNDGVVLPIGNGLAASALRTVLATDQGTIPVSISGSVPVSGPLTDVQLRASAVPISAASLPLPTGAAQDATLTNRTQFSKITDGTNDATVKAASTAAAAADKALVVAVSPNNSVFTNSTAPVSITASNITGVNTNVFSIDLATAGASYRGIGVMLTGTWSAILNYQGSNDNSTWVNLIAYTPGGGVNTSNLTTNDLYNVSCSGMRYIRLRCTSYTSGTVVPFVYGYLSGFELNTINLSGSVSINGTPNYNLSQVGGNAVNTGSGNAGTGTQRVILASDQPAIPTNAALQAGSAIAGKFGIDQTTNGTTNRVNIGTDGTVAANLNAGSNIIGKVGIDQTTPGTTNGVQVNAALPTGSNVIGKVSIDQTTPGTTNGVQINAALPAGTNAIGKLSSNSGVNIGTVDVASIAAGTNDVGYVNPDRTVVSANLTGAGNGNSFAIKGMQSVGVNITGTAATFVFKAQVSFDGGTTWTDTYLDRVAGNKSSTANANGQYTIVIAGGTSHIRVVLNSIVSGTFTYQYTGTMAKDPSVLFTGIQGSGQGLPPFTAQVGGSDGTDMYALSLNAKGTQGAKGLAVQELKDAGRTTIALTIEASGAATSEGLATVTESRNGAATSTFTSKTITSGKKIRWQSIAMQVETLGSGTAPQRVYLRLRVNTAGSTTTSSPLQGVWSVANNPAVVKTGTWANYDFPDGIEFNGDGTATYGWSLTFPDWVTTTATVQVKITIIGYEY